MNIWVDFKGTENQGEECQPNGLTVLMMWAIELPDDSHQMTDDKGSRLGGGGWWWAVKV